MEGTSTYIQDPANMNTEPRKFAFDYSYWSHDCFKEEENGYLSPSTPNYADQVIINWKSIITVLLFLTISKLYNLYLLIVSIYNLFL